MSGADDMRTFAAIMLRVPRSGKPEIDDMIRESQRTEIAARVTEALIAGVMAADAGNYIEQRVAENACAMADALLTELSRGGTKA